MWNNCCCITPTKVDCVIAGSAALAIFQRRFWSPHYIDSDDAPNYVQIEPGDVDIFHLGRSSINRTNREYAHMDSVDVKHATPAALLDQFDLPISRFATDMRCTQYWVSVRALYGFITGEYPLHPGPITFPANMAPDVRQIFKDRFTERIDKYKSKGFYPMVPHEKLFARVITPIIRYGIPSLPFIVVAIIVEYAMPTEDDLPPFLGPPMLRQYHLLAAKALL